jgi:N-acetylglutamate synthase-like GNAT family acetyltransferase
MEREKNAASRLTGRVSTYILRPLSFSLEREMKMDFLIDHMDSIPLISQWYYEEWQSSYAASGMSRGDVEEAITERKNTDRLPLALVGLEAGRVIATGCLKVLDMDTRKELSPWLAGIYVVRDQRRKGYGSLIVKALENIAKDLCIPKLYLYTPQSASFYERLGWAEYETARYKGQLVTIMKRELL